MDLWSLCDMTAPRCVHVAVTLRVAEQIEAGKAEIGAMAEACGANAGALQRVLRQLVSKGDLRTAGGGRFALSDVVRGLKAQGA